MKGLSGEDLYLFVEKLRRGISGALGSIVLKQFGR